MRILQYLMTLISKKHKSHQNKSPISIYDADINKMLVYNKIVFGDQDFKYFIGYKDFEKIVLYTYSLNKLLYIKQFLTKNVFIF